MPAPEDLLEAYEVSPEVNRAANDSARLIEPVTDTAQVEPQTEPQRAAKARRNNDSGQGSLF